MALLVAPCGMNCRLCYAYQRTKNPCGGCQSKGKPHHCRSCVIYQCDQRGGSLFCYDCQRKTYCPRLKRLDKRYQESYHVSLIDNLEMIRDQGMDAFLQQQKQKWTCPKCGQMQCIHHQRCDACGWSE